MEDHKKKMIEQYVQTRLAIAPERQTIIIARINEVCRMQWAIKYQLLESEGRAIDGRAWLSLDAMTHSYYHCKKSGVNWGTLIWKKMEPILFSYSLLEGAYRDNYVQMLEPGYVLSISYPDVLLLRNEFIEIERDIEHVSTLNERAYHRRLMLLNEPSLEKLKKFGTENPLFMTIASNDVKAMHLGITRQGFSLLQKRLRDGQ